MISPLSPPEAPLSEPSEIDRSKRRSSIIQLAPSKGRDTIENYIKVFVSLRIVVIGIIPRLQSLATAIRQ